MSIWDASDYRGHNGPVTVIRLDHVQLAMPAGREAEAIAFYHDLLGIPVAPKPAHLAARGGCWFEQGDLKVHLGVEADFRPALESTPSVHRRGPSQHRRGHHRRRLRCAGRRATRRVRPRVRVRPVRQSDRVVAARRAARSAIGDARARSGSPGVGDVDCVRQHDAVGGVDCRRRSGWPRCTACGRRRRRACRRSNRDRPRRSPALRRPARPGRIAAGARWRTRSLRRHRRRFRRVPPRSEFGPDTAVDQVARLGDRPGGQTVGVRLGEHQGVVVPG